MEASKAKKIIAELIEPSGVQLNGKNPWDVQVHNPAFYDRLLRDGQLGLGESYIDGWWDCEQIDEFVNRILKVHTDQKIKDSPRILLQLLRERLFNLQSRARAFEVGEKHYDLGNDLYRAMLDKRLNYACGYWKNATTLDEAQEAKLELICKKIGARPGMSILELGCGWGGFAKYAAEKYGVQVLGVTVSKEQVALGTELCKGLPVELRLQDYRAVEGKFDAVISIGMMEHIGVKNYRTYMEVVDRCLKEDGIAFIHTIGHFREVKVADEFTNRYVFPNGMLPSLPQLTRAMLGLFVIEDLQNMGPHYDPTLMAWTANFEKSWPQLKDKYSDRFYRMWRYWMLTGAGAFRARDQQLWQIVMTRHGSPQPDCRFS
jgi:cyclopropane-fatty-acyl-phospholipid synthase